MGKKSSGGKRTPSTKLEDDFADLPVAAEIEAEHGGPKTKLGNSTLALHALAVTLPPVLLRDVFGLGALTDLPILAVAFVGATFFQYSSNVTGFNTRSKLASKETAYWRTMVVNGVFTFVSTLLIITYLFDYFFNGISATISEDPIMSVTAGRRVKFLVSILLPPILLFATKGLHSL